jgi:hypothetical protein
MDRARRPTASPDAPRCPRFAPRPGSLPGGRGGLLDRRRAEASRRPRFGFHYARKSSASWLQRDHDAGAQGAVCSCPWPRSAHVPALRSSSPSPSPRSLARAEARPAATPGAEARPAAARAAQAGGRRGAPEAPPLEVRAARGPAAWGARRAAAGAAPIRPASPAPRRRQPKAAIAPATRIRASESGGERLATTRTRAVEARVS